MLQVVKLSQLDLAFVKNYLKIDFDDDDNELLLYIRAAQSFLLNQINIDIELIDEKPDIVIAALLIISHFYEHKSILSPGSKFNNNIDFVLEQILIQYREWF